MLFIALVRSRTYLSRNAAARNMKDTGSDVKGYITCRCIRRTPKKDDTVVMSEAPDEKAAMNMVLKRADRTETETLVALTADASGPAQGRPDLTAGNTMMVPIFTDRKKRSGAVVKGDGTRSRSRSRGCGNP